MHVKRGTVGNSTVPLLFLVVNGTQSDFQSLEDFLELRTSSIDHFSVTKQCYLFLLLAKPGLAHPDALYLTSVFVLRLAGGLQAYRMISVALCSLVGSFTTESPARINLLITSQQTGILWLGFGYPPTSLWRLSDSTST